MAAAGGGALVSRDDYADPDYMAGVMAHDWFMEHASRAREDLDALRMAAVFPSVTRVNGEHPTVEGPGAAFVVGRVMRDLEHAEALLANPTEYVGEEWGDLVPEVALEAAWRIISGAWRLLLRAALHTRTLRDLMALAVAVRRLAAIRRKALALSRRPERPRPLHARRARPAAVLGLSHAAHAPPLGGGGYRVSPFDVARGGSVAKA